ncbi:thymidylate kinase [Plesiocystis pacifica SIR-1]|uniref:Thymidylate kinase n=1 Tax=Plesiocystis pacifica SIR-1 TaxID=391625 RepID=A6GFF3_9BACT|nr:dTMP kinase [Plesiocystis pacifica]EDM75380.1 thymidylate kinase [Plesiocystis pacifica SIR-1]
MNTPIPRFLVFEGIDGSGTTTQLRRVSEALRERGHRVVETRQPSPGPIGALTRELLAVDGGKARTVGPEGLALMFAADRLEHLARVVEPALSEGAVVLCDRYVVSSWVYQSLDCDRAWVRTINTHARWPDRTYVFDLDPEIALARVAARRAETGQVVERFDVPDTQRRLAAGYRAVLDEADLSGLVAVDAAASIDAVTTAIVEDLLAQGF